MTSDTWRPGDRLECINASEKPVLRLGRTYELSGKATAHDGQRMVKLKHMKGSWLASRFRRVGVNDPAYARGRMTDKAEFRA